MFWDTSINRRSTTDGRPATDRLSFCNSFFKLFVYKPVCVCVCVSGIPAFLCVLVSVPLYLYDDA